MSVVTFCGVEQEKREKKLINKKRVMVSKCMREMNEIVEKTFGMWGMFRDPAAQGGQGSGLFLERTRKAVPEWGSEAEGVAEGEAFLRRYVATNAAGAVITGARGAVAQL